MHETKKGVLYGSAAIFLWSTSSVCTVLGGQRVGVWQFLAIACFVGGIAQVLFYRAMKMPLRNIFLPPLKLWAIILACFVLYMLVYTGALVAADDIQTVGVNLANFLWPTLTVLFAIFVVPGTRISKHIFLALLLGLGGLVLANFESLRKLCVEGSNLSVWPYILGVAAGITWALYSVFLARWRNWANQYATAPVGFLLTASICLIICLCTHSWTPMGPGTWAIIVFMGLVPQGLGYLFWELAMHRAPASTLGLLGSATPVLSTIWLLLTYRYRFLGGDQTPPNYIVVLFAASLISGAVLLGALQPRKRL